MREPLYPPFPIYEIASSLIRLVKNGTFRGYICPPCGVCCI
jgi:hypothetical protein